MRYRFLLISGLMVAAFVVITSTTQWPRRVRGWLPSGPLYSEGVVRSAGLSPDEMNNIEVYRKAHDATVNITSTVYRRDWFMEIVPQQGTGSGFVIDQRGLILTNYHVVSGRAPEVRVTMSDKSSYPAKILARDYSNDLALIQINPRKDLAILPLGDSEHLQVGQKVLAIGNPFGLQGTLTTGIISSMGRSLQDENGRRLEGMLQTDAAINPGNSGGPLLDSQGNAIGINTAIYGPGSNIGIGFAMPISRAKSMINDFRAGRSLARPRLGVSYVYLAGDLAEALQLPVSGGLLVQEVERGSGADKAGLRGAQETVIVGNNTLGVGGDFITAIDGKPVEGNEAVVHALNNKRAGDALELTVFRGGRLIKIRVILGTSPEDRL
ncbi:MAG: trypsin-like peptidase domain-containing protein [Bryobacterales bacterium]|nr:trypsin-like peptidase domain-containing protein [Bryobacterales bacterium]